MTLSFSKQLNGKPTYFVEKIWSGMLKDFRKDIIALQPNYLRATLNEPKIIMYAMLKPKINTIREDKTNRWKPANDIHFVINNRTPKRFQFLPVIKCVSTQTIKIIYKNDYLSVLIDNKVFYEQNNRFVVQSEAMELLAHNDGFESKEEFFECFNQNYKGKIIHWTNHKY